MFKFALQLFYSFWTWCSQAWWRRRGFPSARRRSYHQTEDELESGQSTLFSIFWTKIRLYDYTPSGHFMTENRKISVFSTKFLQLFSYENITCILFVSWTGGMGFSNLCALRIKQICRSCCGIIQVSPVAPLNVINLGQTNWIIQ